MRWREGLWLKGITLDLWRTVVSWFQFRSDRNRPQTINSLTLVIMPVIIIILLIKSMITNGKQKDELKSEAGTGFPVIS